MKFSSKLDLELFLTEIDRLDLLGEVDESFVPTPEMEESFIKRRKPLSGALKDFRKSQDTKGEWRTSRHGIMRGINKFHKSTEGKRFHRNLGRFLSSRYFHPRIKGLVKDDQEDSSKSARAEESLSKFDLAEALKAITSIRTHCFIELEYFHPLQEELDYEDFLEEILPELISIEKKLWANEKLNGYDLKILLQLVDKKELANAIAGDTGLESKRIEEAWNEFEKKAEIDENVINFIGEKFCEKATQKVGKR
jgi:hypothetical protein